MVDVANQLWLCIIVEWDGHCNGVKCCNQLMPLVIHLVVDMNCGYATGLGNVYHYENRV